MNLYTVNHKFHYELENLTRAFFPNEKIAVFMLDTIDETPETPYILTVNDTELSVSVCFDKFSKELTAPKGSDDELTMATLLYRLLEEYTDITLSWGLLTGVRPIKLFRKLKEQMGEAQAKDYFKNSLLVSDEKLRLAAVTCKNEEKILNMPESWFKDVGFTENEDGTYSIRVLLEGDRVEEVIGRLGIADMAALGMELSDLCYDIVLDAEGNFVKIVYTFRLTMDVEGEAMVIDSESIITYTGIGSTTVTLPDGCDGYIDVTDQLLNSIA